MGPLSVFFEKAALLLSSLCAADSLCAWVKVGDA
jgi:hypothetical protein